MKDTHNLGKEEVVRQSEICEETVKQLQCAILLDSKMQSLRKDTINFLLKRAALFKKYALKQ